MFKAGNILRLLSLICLVSCRNFDPFIDSSVRDLHFNFCIGQVKDNCELLYDDFGEYNAFHTTVYIYDQEGNLIKSQSNVFIDYSSDTLSCCVPKVDISRVGDIITIGEFVNVNVYGDVTSSVIHMTPAKKSTLSVYTLKGPNCTGTYCTHAMFPFSEGELKYNVNLESTFTTFFLTLNNISEVLKLGYILTQGILYYFEPYQSSGTRTITGTRYNTYDSSNMQLVFSYVPGSIENIMNLTLVLEKKDYTSDTLAISQTIGENKIFECVVDCKTLEYECI